MGIRGFSLKKIRLSTAHNVLDRSRSNRERYFRPVSNMNKERVRFVDKIGMAIIRWHANVRARPSTKAPIVAMYFPGERVYYDRLVENENYLWASYIGRASGKRRYVAIGRC